VTAATGPRGDGPQRRGPGIPLGRCRRGAGRRRQLTTAQKAVFASPQDLQAFREYGESWYRTRKELESRFQPQKPLAQQPLVTAEARCKLVSWLIQVHRSFDFTFESLCLSVNILDRFLDTTSVASDCFQLLGVTALFIACKQVEVDPPLIKDLLALCCDAFSLQQLRTLECVVLERLNFDVAAPTMSFFLEHFIQVRLEAHSDSEREASVAKIVAEGFGVLSLADYSFIKYTPSLLAASSLGLADRLLQHRYPLDLQVHGYSEEDLQECMGKLQLLASLNQETLKFLLPPEVAEECHWLQGVR
ncbi:CCNO protein, partial [Atlantisia rogersi]|nr:CCNO protein [Atlantisia rogersi]